MPTLKILALADRKPEQSIIEFKQMHQPDLIVTLGDFDHSDIRELEQIADIPKIGIYGNHCSGMYFEPLGIQNMHMQTFEFQGILFGGFEGSVRYKESKYAKMYTQDEAKELLERFPHVDVMLTHCPPYGVNDEPDDLTHMGFLGLRYYVEREKPKHLFHGHTYPKPGEEVTVLDQTAIHYVSGMELVTITV